MHCLFIVFVKLGKAFNLDISGIKEFQRFINNKLYLIGYYMKSLNPVYIHNFLNGIAESMVKVFVPVLILEYMGSIMWSIAYVGIFYLANLFLNLILNKLILKYNITFLIIHVFLFLLTPILIAFFQIDICLVIILAIAGGFGQALYYSTIENLYTYSNQQINMAKFDAFCSLGYFIFSLTSAFILGSHFSNSLLLVCISSIIIYLASLLPFFVKRKNLPKFNIKEFKPYPKTKFYKLYFLFWMFSAVGFTITNMIIPIYIYTINPSIQLIGIVLAATYLVEIGLDFLCRWLRLKNLQVLSIGIYFVLFTISVLTIILWHNNIVLVVMSTLGGLSYLFSYITMQGNYFEKIKQDNCAPIGILYKNIACSIMRIIIIALYFILPSFLTIFISSIICSLIAFIITIMLHKTQKETKLLTDKLEINNTLN